MKKGHRCMNCASYFQNIPESEHNQETCYGRAYPPDDCGEMISVLEVSC